ncbi:MAG TPA: hypothetical protein VML91_23230 [Burkholderiales bacterium]|nr:hypothetical protein [Burkholderiales bacterium]
MAARDLVTLERSKDRFGAGTAEAKLILLARLDRTNLRTPPQVERLHEALCFMRAYPGDAIVLAAVEHILERFPDRADLRRHRAALVDSGIAGTAIRFRFFWPSALWLAGRSPDRLLLDRDDADAEDAIARALPLLVTPAESAALRELDLPGYAAVDRLRGRREADGAFLVRRVASMPGDTFTREAFFDAIDASFELVPGPDTPARTHAKLGFAPIAFPDPPLHRGRPDLRAELRRAPRAVKPLSLRAGRCAVELGRAAMATRERDIDGFAYGDARDAWLVDDGDGLAFTLNGVVPERRAVVPATYGSLTLRNGVPIAYLQVDLAGRSAALSYHAFATFRGGEAAYTVARMLAMLHHVLGAESFTLDPYQLGKDNEDGIESGAWWFYYKLGFRPRTAAVKRVTRGELARLQANPRHRSSAATLRKLAEGHLVIDVDPRHPVPLPRLAAIGIRIADRLAARGERAQALQEAGRDAMRLLGLRSLDGWTPGERLAWERWSPLILTLPGVSRWSAANRRSLTRIVRAKGGRSESEYAARFNAHPLLGRALLGAGPRRRAASAA